MTFWQNLIDTVLNLSVFIFIGVLLWLYLTDVPKGGGQKKKKRRKRA